MACRKSEVFLVATIAPCRTAIASIKLSLRACGWRLTSGLCLNFAHTRAVSDSQSSTSEENSLKKPARCLEISSLRARDGGDSSPSWISAIITTGISHSAEPSHSSTFGSGSFLQSSEMIFESSRNWLMVAPADLRDRSPQAF